MPSKLFLSMMPFFVSSLVKDCFQQCTSIRLPICRSFLEDCMKEKPLKFGQNRTEKMGYNRRGHSAILWCSFGQGTDFVPQRRQRCLWLLRSRPEAPCLR